MKVFFAFAVIIGIGAAYLFSLSFMKPDPLIESQIRGQILYANSCAACHGANLEGQENWRIQNADGSMPAPPHNAEGHTWHHDDDMLFEYTKFGGAATMAARGVTGFNSGMPAFEGLLSDENINDIWAYIKSTWSDRERGVQAERTAAEAAAKG